jgi:hypothetical protein
MNIQIPDYIRKLEPAEAGAFEEAVAAYVHWRLNGDGLRELLTQRFGYDADAANALVKWIAFYR